MTVLTVQTSASDSHFQNNSFTIESLKLGNMSSDHAKVRPGTAYCGVPECKSIRTKNTSLHFIPKYVLSSEILREQWKAALKMTKEFPKNFKICSHHFDKRQIITAVQTGKTILTQKAFPSLNLPQSFAANKNGRGPARQKKRLQTQTKIKRLATVRRSPQNIEDEQSSASFDSSYAIFDTSLETQCVGIGIDKAIQVNVDPSWYITDLCTTDYKLNILTGIPTLAILKGIIKSSRIIRTEDNCPMPLKDRILMTMRKLKANISFADIAITFQITEKDARLYFADCIQLLAEVTDPLIYWQSRKENLQTMPQCFEPVSNVITVLESLELTLRCSTCFTRTSHYHEEHTTNVLIGFSPSGQVNFIGPTSTGKQFAQAKFDLSDLLGKLRPGDAVMVGEDLLIGNELLDAGIEIVKPAFDNPDLSREEIQKMDKKIYDARVHVDRQLEKIQTFNVLSQKISASIRSYASEIVTIICGISNL